PVLTQDGARWYIQGDAYTHPKLMRQAPGEEPGTLRETEEDTRLSADAGNGVLMSQVEICRDYNLLYDLHAVDAHGKRTDISRCSRHRFAAPLTGQRIAAVSASAGMSEVVLLEGGRPAVSLYRAAPGEIIS